MWPSPLHFTGPVVLSSPAQLVAPVLVARGTLSITTTEIYFEVDEDDPAFKRVDSKVSNLQASVQLKFKAASWFQTCFSVFFCPSVAIVLQVLSIYVLFIYKIKTRDFMFSWKIKSSALPHMLCIFFLWISLLLRFLLLGHIFGPQCCVLNTFFLSFLFFNLLDCFKILNKKTLNKKITFFSFFLPFFLLKSLKCRKLTRAWDPQNEKFQ